MKTQRARWLGLQQLLQEAIDHGSHAIERVQIESAGRPFWILERLPPIAPAARFVHAAFDASVITTHALIRTANGALGEVMAAGIERLHEEK